MIHLHYNPSNASMTPHMVLRELGVPFELKFVDREHGALQSPEYLKLNPNGLIPVLVDGDLVLYETAAIVLYLIEKYPAAGLAPPVGTPERAIFYKWLMWLACTVQPMVPHYFYSHRMAAPGNTAGAAEVKAQAEAKLGIYYDRIDAQLASHGGPWFAGERFSVLDPYAFMLCRWSRAMQRPARTLPHIGPYLSRMLARPAVRKVFEVEELKEPYF